MKVRSFILWAVSALLSFIFPAPGWCGAVPLPENYTLKADLIRQGRNFRSSRQSGLTLDTSRGSCRLLNFRGEKLEAVVKYWIEKLALQLGIQAIRVKNGEPRIQVCPLLRNEDQLSPELAEGVDFGTPVAEISLAAGKTGDEVLIPLNIRTPEQERQILRNGILIRLVSDGKCTGSVDFYSSRPDAVEYSWWFRRMPALRIRYTNLTGKLALYPKIKIRNGKFVSRRGADFLYDGKVLRLSGINVSTNNFRSYEDIDILIDRLGVMNLNAIRLWASKLGPAGNNSAFYTPESTREKMMVKSGKGDGSYADYYDYLTAKCQELGIFIHNTSLGSHTPPMKYWPGNPHDLVDKPLSKSDTYVSLHYQGDAMLFLDDVYLEARIRHIRNFLNRVNPYTGQRYAEMPVFATWELGNEVHFNVQVFSGNVMKRMNPCVGEALTRRWNEYLRGKYQTQQALLRAWGKVDPGEELEKGNIYPGPDYSNYKKYPVQRMLDLVDFTQQRCISVYRTLEETARSCAGKGIGINQAPILHTTFADHCNLNAFYACTQGDFASGGIYQAWYTHNKKNPYYPYRPMFAERPYFYFLNFMTRKDRPFMVYEHSYQGHYGYPAEWCPAIHLVGAGLGWDAIYLYGYSGNGDLAHPLNLRDFPLYQGPSKLIPLSSTPAPFRSGDAVNMHFYHEETLASNAIAAQAFINGLKPNSEPLTVTYGPAAYRHFAWRGYNLQSSYPMMMASIRSRLQFEFDPDQKAEQVLSHPLPQTDGIGWDPVVPPRIDFCDTAEIVKASPDITWAPSEKYFSVDCSHSKIVVGAVPNGFAFQDGVSVGKMNHPFAFFGVSSRDGKPIAQSDEVIFSIVGRARNTGEKFNLEKPYSISYLGVSDCLESFGHLPVIHDRYTTRVVLPLKNRIIRFYNFEGYCFRQEPFDGSVVISENEPLYMAVVSRE